jgi:hypothetical protein
MVVQINPLKEDPVEPCPGTLCPLSLWSFSQVTWIHVHRTLLWLIHRPTVPLEKKLRDR